MQIIEIDKAILNNDIEQVIQKHSEMSLTERAFLCALLEKYKPQKILEVGVAAGANSLIILDKIKASEDAKLYSIDLFDMHYKYKDKKTGFLVDNYPELKNKWTLLTGKIACNHMGKIGNEIDMCIIDTVHSNPGEFIDFLQILPFMKDNGVVILHDTAFHVNRSYKDRLICRFSSTCCQLFNTIAGEKLIPSETEQLYFSNIGAVILDSNIKEKVFEVFNSLTLPWAYIIPKNQYLELLEFLRCHYDDFYIDIFQKAYDCYKGKIALFYNFARPPKKLSFVNKIKQCTNLIKIALKTHI